MPNRYSTFTGKRKPIKKISDKRLASLDARDECVKIVRERDRNLCRLDPRSPFYEPWWRAFDLPGCGGPLDPHEPLTRQRGGDATDPDQVILICRRHHDWAHDEDPETAETIGVLIPSDH